MINAHETDDLLQLIDTSDDYSVFGGVDTQEYFEQYEQSGQSSYFPTEEEYLEYLAMIENDQARD
jgi:hypothetical protein